jgi:MFS family permease
MASSHPVITSYFNASNSASWLSTAFLLTSTAFQPLFGRLSDALGRRPLFLFSIIVFAGTTAWCALAKSIGSFIAARAACGLGAGGVLAMGSIMTNDLVKIEVRGTYQAYINLFYGVGSTCGAAFGGYLCDTLGWRKAFGVQIPPILIMLVVAGLTVPPDLGPQMAKTTPRSLKEIIQSFDLTGSFFLSTSAAMLILGLNLGGNIFPWKHPLVITSLILSVVFFAILMRIESRVAKPVMPMSMLWTKPRGNLVFSNFFANIGVNTIIFNTPLYFQAVKLDSPSASGFRLAVHSVAITICGVSTGFFITWTGRMYGPLIIGAVALVVASVCLTTMCFWTDIPIVLSTAFLAPTGIGQGIAFPAASIAVLATSTQDDQAVMTSTLTLWRSLGIVLGVAISSLILQNALRLYLEVFVSGEHKAEVSGIFSSLSSTLLCTEEYAKWIPTGLTAGCLLDYFLRAKIGSFHH